MEITASYVPAAQRAVGELGREGCIGGGEPRPLDRRGKEQVRVRVGLVDGPQDVVRDPAGALRS